LSGSISLSQENLILNGDFEEYWDCPENYSEIEQCKHVYNPIVSSQPLLSSTSDYFNECVVSNVGVPLNAFGYQQSRSGSGYVGLITYKKTTSDYNEYIQLEFSQTLSQGAIYVFSIYSNLSNNSEYSTKNIQFKFIDSNNDYNVFLDGIMSPDYRYDSFLRDTLDWERITFEYQADGTEKYVIIGNFDSLQNESFEYLYDISGFNQGIRSYNYFDDAELILLHEANSIQLPNVFTPNNDGVNDILTFIKSEGLFDYTITIINRWGNRVYYGENNFHWDGNTQNGEPVTEGNYFYTLEYNNNEVKQGFVHLKR
jgi:gliding motility-associated-like protein